jgi:porin
MRKFITLLLGFSFSLICFSQENKNAIELEATYISDNVANISGGIKKGYAYLGMANLRLGVNTGSAGLWKNGKLFINAANTHGATPSADLVGDIQVLSNIEAGNHTFIQELWYLQSIKKFDITIGLQDLNVEFVNSENGSMFINSSFGIMPIISNNVAAPIFPLTALGLTIKWNFSEKSTWLMALYDGCPLDFEENPYNLKWDFKPTDGVLSISEYHLKTNLFNKESTFKLGAVMHRHFEEKSEIPDSIRKTTLGFYTTADVVLYSNNGKNLNLFAQAGYSPSSKSINDKYLTVGLNFNGLLKKDESDYFGLAFAHESVKNVLKPETAIELTYHCPITKNIFIQPDIQYIVNPAGTGRNLQNSLVCLLRCGLIFDR